MEDSNDKWKKKFYEDEEHTRIKLGNFSDSPTTIDPIEGKALVHEIQTNHNITSIDLNNRIFNEDITTAIINAIQINPSISNIFLYRCKFSSDIVLQFGHFLPSNISITSLYIGGCEISEAGHKSIGRALESNSSLTSLRLGNSAIRSDAAKSIINSLHSNYSLTHLELWNSNFGVDEVKNISTVINSSNCILSLLQLNKCDINDDIVIELASALWNNTSIVNVNLSMFEKMNKRTITHVTLQNAIVLETKEWLHFQT